MALADSGHADAERIARAFVDARRAGRALPTYPGTPPVSLSEAYAIQDAAIGLHDDRVAGWKLGKIGPDIADGFGANRLAGPIFARGIVHQGESAVEMPVFADGFAAAEAEFLLRIGTVPDPHKSDYDIPSATALIDAVHAGIEIASSPYPAINADGPAITASDFGNNNGLIVGAAIADWRAADLNAWPLELRISGEIIGTGQARDMLDGPFGAAAFLFNLAAERGLTLAPGMWISSGAVTGVHPVAVGDTVEAQFDGGYSICCTIASY